MPNETVVYLVANLVLFALVLLTWAHASRPRWVTSRGYAGSIALFLFCQGMALCWSWIRLEPWAFAHLYLSTMLLTEIIVIVSVFLEWRTAQGTVAPVAITFAFVLHSYATLFTTPPAAETLQTPPFARSPCYLLHLLTVLVAFAAYTCAGAGALRYLIVSVSGSVESASKRASEQDCQAYIRTALAISFPWLTAALIMGALWRQFAWGSYWSWRTEEVWLLIVWLILTANLHLRTVRRRHPKPLAFLSLLGLVLAVLGLPLLGYGLSATG